MLGQAVFIFQIMDFLVNADEFQMYSTEHAWSVSRPSCAFPSRRSFMM